MDGHIMRCGTIGSAATSEIVKRCWSRVLTHVSGAVASVQTFTILPLYALQRGEWNVGWKDRTTDDTTGKQAAAVMLARMH